MRIAIAEHLLMWRQAIAKTCARDLGHDVVLETGSGIETLREVQREKPDILLLALFLPDLDGFAVIERLRNRFYGTKILLLSANLDDYTVHRVEKARVHGFVDLRQEALGALDDALQLIAAGGTYFSPSFESARHARHADPRSFDKILSESEQRILCLIGEGLTDDEIGPLLGISPRTVQTHRHNLLRKLGVSSTPKLIAFAMRHGFTPCNPPLNPGRIPAGFLPVEASP